MIGVAQGGRGIGWAAARWIGRLLLAGSCAILPAAAYAEAAAVVAARLAPDEHIRLDGTLSHPAWRRAPVYDAFVENTPELGIKARHDTRVQVLFDERALYVGVQALDTHPELIRAPLVRHDGVNRTQDFVVVYVDAVGTRQSAQFFRVNAAGSTADGMHTAADDSEDFAPDFDFDAAAARNPQGYTVVLRIPFASLRFVAGRGGSGWRFMVGRRVPREQFTLDTSVLVPRDAPSFIAALQPLQGVVLPERHQFLTLRPSLTWREQRDAPAGAPTTRASSVDATLDVKWRPLPEWVLDATLNPDFSQVALDVPQLAGNTRFALSLAEKRPFFFESSDLLRTPTEALYTRSLTEPRWGLRSTWRARSLAGTAFAIEDRGGGLVLLPGAFGTDLAEQPASSALALRLRHDTGALQWGGLAVARRYAGARGANQVFGPDLAWQIDPSWRLRGQWLHSDTSAQPDGLGELARGALQRADRVMLKLTRLTDHSDATIGIDDIGRGFRHDTGFVPQSGVRGLSANYSHGWRQLGPLNEAWLNLRFAQARAKQDGTIVSRDFSPGIWLAGPHNLDASIYWHGRSQLRTAAAAPLLDQHFWQGDLTFTPAPWIPFAVASVRVGRLSDVLANEVRPGGDFTLSLTTRPLPRLEFEPRWSTAWLDHGGARAYRESAAQVLAVWHFDARQTLRAIVQHSALDRKPEALVAEAHEDATVGSLTYAWRRSTGTVLYLGASRSRQGLQAASRSNEVFIKLQVDADEVRAAF